MDRPTKRLVIIGGVAAGATAAARARRLDESVEITLIDRGRYVSFANCGLPSAAYLRDAIDEVPRDRPLVVFSKTGFEGHIAARILRGAGLEQVRYVSGGMRSVSLVRGSERHLRG